ncbi:MAG: hypothetical protein LBH94_00545, partial [Deltaproteobacteria bacterium]|nr:hypothetical protein [Deltaproteobacteria bacterium]
MPSIAPASIPMSDFTRLTQSGGQDGALKVSGNRLSETGKLGAFFMSQTDKRAAIESFVGALRKEYGGRIADMIGKTVVSDLRESGKPLTARLVRDMTALAQAEKARVNAYNQELVIKYINGDNPEKSLDGTINEVCAKHGIAAPQDKALVRTMAANLFMGMAGAGEFFPNITNADALKEKLPFILFPYRQTMAIAESSSLPGTLSDRLSLADMAWSKTSDTAFLRSIAELDAMRRIQPNGDITPETVYKALFKQDPPANLAGDKLLANIAARCEQDKQELLQRIGFSKEPSLITNIKQMPWDKLSALMAKPNTVTLDHVSSIVGMVTGKHSLEGVQKGLRLDPPRVYSTPDGPNHIIPTFSFRFDDGNGGTRTESVQVGGLTNFPFTDDADKAAYRKTLDNTLALRLESLCQALCGQGASEEQLINTMSCLSQGALMPLRMVSELAGTKFDEHSNVGISLSRQPDGSIKADFASPPEMKDAAGQFTMSLTIAPDGKMTVTAFEMLPPLAVRQERANEAATEARIARVNNAYALAEPFRALDDSPNGLFAQIESRAHALDPQAKLAPELWKELDLVIGNHINGIAKAGVETVTEARVLEIRTAVLDEFFGKLDQAAAQVPQEQRAAFVRGCLELGAVPDAALMPAMRKMVGTVENTFKSILNAQNGQEVRSIMLGLRESMRSVTIINPDFAGKEASFFTPALCMAMRLGMQQLMGGDDPEAFARALVRPGPFRDMLHMLAHDETEESAYVEQALNWFLGGMTRILPDEILEKTLNPHEIRERDLSLPRQREILGQGNYAARGIGVAVKPELAGLNQSLQKDLPVLQAHIRASAESDLIKGPGTGARTASGLSVQFMNDYDRVGVFVNGR